MRSRKIADGTGTTVNSVTFQWTASTAGTNTISAKISRAKTLVRFSRYRAAQETAPEEKRI